MGEIILLIVIGAGTLGGFFAGRLPMSGAAALGLSLVPLAGMGLVFTLC